MLRFISQRMFFIALVSVFIVLVVNVGMRMVSNSNIPEPDFDLVPVTKLAWEDTKEFFSGLISGDLGTFQRQGGTFEVIEVMQDMYIKSMGLMGVALAAAAALGFLVGGFIALTRHRHLIAPLLTLTILGVSIPSFFGGFILQRTVAYYKDDYEFLRKLTLVGFDWDFRHMFLPVLVLSARPLAYITRSAFISLEHVMKEDFIRTAYAKGLRERWIVLDHAFRNIAVPVLTTLGVSLRFSLSKSAASMVGSKLLAHKWRRLLSITATRENDRRIELHAYVLKRKPLHGLYVSVARSKAIKPSLRSSSNSTFLKRLRPSKSKTRPMFASITCSRMRVYCRYHFK